MKLTPLKQQSIQDKIKADMTVDDARSNLGDFGALRDPNRRPSLS